MLAAIVARCQCQVNAVYVFGMMDYGKHSNSLWIKAFYRIKFAEMDVLANDNP